MTQWIIFDVDDVIVSYRESLHQSFKALGQDIHWSQWNTYKHVKIYGLANYEEFVDHMRQHNVLENALIEEGVVDLLNQLKKDGYSIGFLTARSWHPEGYRVTERLVQQHNLPVDKIVISGFKGKKTDHIHNFPGKIAGFLDDSPGHVKDFMASGIKNCYVMDRPWNQNATELPRIKNYEDFYHILLKKPNIKIKKFT